MNTNPCAPARVAHTVFMARRSSLPRSAARSPRVIERATVVSHVIVGNRVFLRLEVGRDNRNHVPEVFGMYVNGLGEIENEASLRDSIETALLGGGVNVEAEAARALGVASTAATVFLGTHGL